MILRLCSGQVTAMTKLGYVFCKYGPIVYRLGHGLFKPVSRVRFPVGSP